MSLCKYLLPFALVLVLLLPPVPAETTDSRAMLGLQFSHDNLVYSSGQDIGLDYMGYFLDTEGPTTFTFQLTDNQGRRIYEGNATHDDRLFHSHSIPGVDLGNVSEMAYTVRIIARYPNGLSRSKWDNIVITHPADDYDAYFYDGGSTFKWLSDDPFTLTFDYYYGGGRLNSTVFRNVTGAHDFDIDTTDLVSVSVTIEDRWGHMNAREPVVHGNHIPITYLYRPEEHTLLQTLEMALIIILLTVAFAAIVLFMRWKQSRYFGGGEA